MCPTVGRESRPTAENLHNENNFQRARVVPCQTDESKRACVKVSKYPQQVCRLYSLRSLQVCVN